ncbi:hypothetical protein [Hyphomicrobium sp. DY-1]|uniref:hypothetical protein n=1 Tax=Hyphomicrobium sp. DY-1 TaxID=3075650 RepID=UPI0039C43781
MAAYSSLKTARLKSKRGSIARGSTAPHTDAVSSDAGLLERVRVALENQMRSDPSAWKDISPKVFEEIVSGCVVALENVAHPEAMFGTTIIDPVSGLELPPKAELLFQDRAKKYGRRISIEEFIAGEKWHAYREAGLLYSEFIRNADEPLYKAINDRARRVGSVMKDYLGQLGILSRGVVSNPPPELLRQARLIKAALVGLERTRSKEKTQEGDELAK